MAKRRRKTESDTVLKLEKKFSAVALRSKATKSQVVAASASMIAACLSRLTQEGRVKLVVDLVQYICEISEKMAHERRSKQRG
jgi:hypothetical protein